MFCIKRSFGVITILILLYSFAIFSACNSIPRNTTHPEISNADIQKGKILAGRYCQTCHALPDPSLLDSKSWETGVLPLMGPRLGIFYFNHIVYPSSRFDRNVDINFYPSVPIMKLDEWQNIIDYYIAVSPDSLSGKTGADVRIKNDLSLFTAKTPAYNYGLPATAFVKVTARGTAGYLLVSDALKRTLYTYNKELQLTDSVKTNGPIVDAAFQDTSFIACNIGILNPNNGKYGSAINMQIQSDGKIVTDTTTLFAGLARPVQITSGDLNNDGKKDYAVCEFGSLAGALSWMENLGNGKFERHVLRPFPGAVKAYINDFDHDGLSDLWALFSQGEEGIFLFKNKGHGHFEQKQVLRFPPVYGSSYFEFADFNNDGHPDIVYTCGDNADYSPVLKPYHGVYIFINDGTDNFRQQYFFHINGCYKAIARDYDNDGDLDLATISFFTDYLHRPEEGFVYLENTGNFEFTPRSLPVAERGRWMTMDAGDVNGDGNIDLILGNFSIGPTLMKHKYDWKKAPPFIVLENVGKKHS